MEDALQLGRPPLPREHGAWAMLLTPPVVALVAAGPNLLGIIATLGWFFAYALRGPLEVLTGASPTGRAGAVQAAPALARRWLVLFGLATALCLGPVVYLRPWALALLAGAAVLLFGVKYLADRGQTRSVSAGVLAIIGLMAGGPLYYLAALGSVPRAGWVLAFAAGGFFIGSVFRVKSLVREKRSVGFRLISVVLHAVIVLAAIAGVVVAHLSPLLPLALAAPLGWAIYGAVRAGAPVNLATIGRGEQWLTICFGLLLMAALRLS